MTQLDETSEISQSGIIVFVRHGQSVWNFENRFTGWHDVELTSKGRDQATATGIKLAQSNIIFSKCFTSLLQRAIQTADLIANKLKQQNLLILQHQALNERDYGDLTGMNKDEAREKFGKDQVHKWRRSFDTKPPNGESLKDTIDRVLPYFEAEIFARALKGDNILVVAHGNSIRSILMHLWKLTPQEIEKVEVGVGQPIAVQIDADGLINNLVINADNGKLEIAKK